MQQSKCLNVTTFKNLSKFLDLNYQLIVICGSDNEYRSTIVSSLDKYRKQPLPVNIARTREYIASKLRIEEEEPTGIIPAAFVDSERFYLSSTSFKFHKLFFISVCKLKHKTNFWTPNIGRALSHSSPIPICPVKLIKIFETFRDI